MPIYSKPVLVWAMLGISLGGVAQSSNPTGPETATSLTLVAVSDKVTAGTPVLVDVSMTNTSQQDVSIPGAMPEDFYRFDVRGPDGNVPVVTKFGFYRSGQFFDVIGKFDTGDVQMRYLNSNESRFTLKAGQSFTNRVEPSRHYDMSEPGTYTIVLEHPDPVSWHEVKSNRVTVMVVPTPPSPSAEAVPAVASFSLTIDYAGQGSGSNDPVAVHLVTKNISDHRVLIRREEHADDVALLGPVFRVDVRDAKGAIPPQTELGRQSSNQTDIPPDPSFMAAARTVGDLVSIGPGQDWWDTITVSRLYELRHGGQYIVKVRRWDAESKTWVKSNIVPVTLDHRGTVKAPPAQ